MIDFILSLFFPDKCPYCNKILKLKMTECDSCRESFPQYPETKLIPSGEECVAPFIYDSAVRNSIIKYKFKGEKFNAKSYVKAISLAIEKSGYSGSFDVVTYVPVTVRRMKERGFNQSEVLAEGIAVHFEKKYERLLKKIKDNRNQHELSSKEREKNIIGVYRAVNSEKIKGKRILLVDDIVTTGYTLSECCKVLKESGAQSVVCVAIAVTK